MRQAIDEEFIMDVVQYYTPVETSYQIAKAIKENPEYEEPPATKAIKAYLDNHQYVIDQAVEVIVEKFREITLTKINGTAKEALEQINSKGYAVPYQTDGRKVVKVGVRFSTETLAIENWEIEE
jgi:type I restriction enzyme R subunit